MTNKALVPAGANNVRQITTIISLESMILIVIIKPTLLHVALLGLSTILTNIFYQLENKK